MSDVKEKMKNWLTIDVCKNVEDFELKLRELIRQDKITLKNINSAYINQDTHSMQNIITEFMIEKKIFIKVCSHCDKTNFIQGSPNEKVFKRKCEFCQESIFTRKQDKGANNDSEDHLNSDNITSIRSGTCIYCGKPTYLGSKTCYDHNHIDGGERLYDGYGYWD